MQKKGLELAPNMVIVIVLGLIVLAIAAVMIYQYSTKSGKQIGGYINETGPGQLRKCDSFIFGRKCITNTSCSPGYTDVSAQYDPCPSSGKCCEPNA